MSDILQELNDLIIVAAREVSSLRDKLAAAEKDAERYRATKWALILHLDADDAGPAAEKLDADVDATVSPASPSRNPRARFGRGWSGRRWRCGMRSY